MSKQQLILLYPDVGCVGLELLTLLSSSGSLHVKIQETQDYLLFKLSNDQKNNNNNNDEHLSSSSSSTSVLVLFVMAELNTKNASKLCTLIESLNVDSVKIVSGLITSSLKVDQVHHLTSLVNDSLSSTDLFTSIRDANIVTHDHFLVAMIRFLQLTDMVYEVSVLSTKKTNLNDYLVSNKKNQDRLSLMKQLLGSTSFKASSLSLVKTLLEGNEQQEQHNINDSMVVMGLSELKEQQQRKLIESFNVGKEFNGLEKRNYYSLYV